MIEDFKFIIFGRSTCPFCVYAVDFCAARKLEHIFLDYDSEPDILEEYKLFYEQETVPIILSNHLSTGETKKVGGYTDLLEAEKEAKDAEKPTRKKTRSKSKNN